MLPLQPLDSHFVQAVDPFGQRGRFFPSLLNAVLATALFRCWHLITFFTVWAACICLVSHHVHDLGIEVTLLTVWVAVCFAASRMLGTVLGFVISYRTSSSFERYNEGRRLWASVILASRTFSRFVWFHVPETWSTGPGSDLDAAEQKARTIVEKKTTINLLEAFAVALKHYLRGEDGIYYEDLYHLVKFLPAYSLPAGLPMDTERESFQERQTESEVNTEVDLEAQHPKLSTDPVRSKSPLEGSGSGLGDEKQEQVETDPPLYPSQNPPQYSVFDVFPFSLLVRYLTRRGKDIKGKKGVKERIKTRVVSHNIPLEITHYLSSYISSLQQRKHVDVPTTNTLIAALNLTTDSLTGLERVLTTPIPFSYSVHLWTVTAIYLFALPFQLWHPLGWIAIPATSVASFIFFGFLVAGEEIENPFGYDKNDLNLDHFTSRIIRLELQSLTSRPMPDIADWAFQPNNNRLFGSNTASAGVKPEEWVRKGVQGMRVVMEKISEPRMSNVSQASQAVDE